MITGGTASGLTLNDGYTEEIFAVTGTTPALSPTNGSIQTWTLSGNSTYGGKGGGGGGGKVVRVAPTITGSGTVTVTGGSAAGTGAGTAAAGGSGVNLSITDTPTIMLTKEIEGPHIDLLYRWHTAFGKIKSGEELRLNSARPAAVWCAQFYPVEKREALVNEWLFGEDLSGGKTATIERREDLNDAA